MSKKVYDVPEEHVKRIPFFHPLSRRFHMILLILLGLFSFSIMRMNIAIGMTCMVNSTAVTQLALENQPHNHSAPHVSLVDLAHAKKKIHVPQKCGVSDDGQKIVNDYGGTFVWDAQTQGFIFAAAFYGSMITLVPGGVLADIWSPVWLLHIAAIILTVVTGLTPYVATELGPGSVFALRFLMGLGEGLILPSFNKLVTQWIPNEEKSTAISIYTSGNQIGGIVGVPFFAYLCGTRLQWPAIFYASCVAGATWLFLWNRLFSPSPKDCKRMTNRERAYLNSCPELKTSQKNNKFSIPGKAMFLSMAFWSLIACSFATNMMATLMQTYIPTFVKEVMFLNPVDNGLFSAASPLAQFFAKIFWSIFIDNMKLKGLHPSVAVKISQSLTSYGTGIMLILIGYYSDCESPKLTLVLLILLGVFLSTATSGFFTAMVSMAPSYTGILTSISFIFAVTGRASVTFVVPYFNKTGALEEWRSVFIVVAVVLFVSGTLFNIFGSSVPQDWGTVQEKAKPEEVEKMTLENQASNQLGSLMFETADV
uniref:MFS domain-containing protein n=1 Tax=Panagrellus redivivus TaxID=6233 RepID=A0A7E4UR78_PANRE